MSPVANAASNRVWMEELEGRVLLSGSPPWSRGVDLAGLPVISLEQPATGLTGGVDSWFVFDGVEGERYAFDPQSKSRADITIWDQDKQQAMSCGNCGEPMPYSGIYYIEVSWGSGEVFPYTFLPKRIVDDQEGGQPLARVFDIGTPVSGKIDYYEDDDWFKFEAAADATYGFEALNQDGPVGVEIFSADGQQLEVDYKNDSCCFSMVEWVAPSAGTYYVRVSDYGRSDYTLYSVQEKTADPRAPGVAPLLGFSSRAAGSLARPGDVQYFSFAALTNATYRVQVHDGTAAGQILVGLMGSDGTFIDRGWGNYQGYQSGEYTYGGVWTAPADGVYYLMVRTLFPGDAGTYSIEIGEDRDDYSNSPGPAAMIDLDEDVSGNIQYTGDADWFAVDAVDGQTYSLSLMRGEHAWGDAHWRRQLTGSWDLHLNIYDTENNELVAVESKPLSDIWGLWTAPATGRFLIQVSTGGIVVPYSFRMEKAAEENPPAEMRAGDMIAMQFAAAGESATLRLIGEAGKKYLLNFPAGKVIVDADQPYLADVDSGSWWWDDEQGIFVFEPDRDSILDVEFTANEPVSWWASMEDRSGTGQPAAEEEEEEIPQLVAGEKELADGQDVRAFAFAAVAGRRYVFQTILGTLEDSTLTIYDENGDVVAENDDVSDDDLSSNLEWTAEKSGTYFVVVGGFGGGSFELSAFEGEGAKRNELKLTALAVADARLQFGGDSSGDDEQTDEGDNSLLSDDYEELDFSDEADLGF